MQELRDAIEQFRASGGAVAGDGKWGGEERKFTIAVADTFGEGGPVRCGRALGATLVALTVQVAGPATEVPSNRNRICQKVRQTTRRK